MGEPTADAPSGATDLCVVGNLLIDVILRGVRELPEWGQEVLVTGRSEDVGGQGANLARAAVRLGLSTEIVSVVGHDASGSRIREVLGSEGVGTGALERVDGDTALAVAAVRPDGERAFITDLACSGELGPEMLARHRLALTGARAVAVVGTANLPGLAIASVASVLREVRDQGGLTVFDPGWLPGEPATAAADIGEVLAVTDVFLPNRDEAELLTGTRDVGGMLRTLRDRCPGVVIVKCGAEGSVTLDGDRIVAVDALPVEVDSAVGAGDVFDAGVISALLGDRDIVSAMVCGTAATSLYISRASQRYATIENWREVAPQVTSRRRS